MTVLQMEKLSNFVNGEWVDVPRSTAVINPATGEELLKCPSLLQKM